MPIPIPGRAAEDLRRSTVQVLSESARHQGNGSGVVLPGERVLTNAHVVRGAHLTVQTWEGKSLSATVLKIDDRRDLALLAIHGLRAPTISLGDSDRLRPGTPVFAVGNPFGFVGAVSSGVIHSIGPLRSINGLPWDLHWIQADVRLAPGNSGGPLATLDGQVVGLNTMVVGGGIALAVPSRAAEAFLAREKNPPNLGITVRPVETKAGKFGLMILELAAGGAAEAASLLPGDLLIGANNVPFRYVDDLQNALLQTKGSTLILDFTRAGNPIARHVTVQLRRSNLSSAA
ncbi:MAG TPA: trypsin-like peptidase domain-containing protein [Bryobacteraceae bacterium]|nr:trypsin-like peptidase domain-containing protein [Bryobacteraceae bacterium]